MGMQVTVAGARRLTQDVSPSTYQGDILTQAQLTLGWGHLIVNLLFLNGWQYAGQQF